MIPMSDIKWFIDPVQSPHIRSNRVYVLKERYPRPSRTSQVGTIVTVKGFEHTGKHVWWITDTGQYVYGAPVGAMNHPSYRPTVALLNDDVFVVGDSYTTSESNKTLVLRTLRRSDMQELDIANGSNSFQIMNVKDFMVGAPWARTDFPMLNDTDEVVRLKVEIAKAKWERRWAEAEIMREGFSRGWDEDLKELNSDGHMDRPVWGAMVTGTAMLPITTPVELNEVDRTMIEGLAAKGALTTSTIAQPMMSVPVKYAVNLDTSETDAVNDPGRNVLMAGLRHHLGTSRAILGDTETTPVLTGTV